MVGCSRALFAVGSAPAEIGGVEISGQARADRQVQVAADPVVYESEFARQRQIDEALFRRSHRRAFFGMEAAAIDLVEQVVIKGLDSAALDFEVDAVVVLLAELRRGVDLGGGPVVEIDRKRLVVGG